ncbi:MAG: hypothetical protein ABI273_17190 [Lacunisphaera sp.]
MSDELAPTGMEEGIGGTLGPGRRVNLSRRKSIQPAPTGKFSLLQPPVP